MVYESDHIISHVSEAAPSSNVLVVLWGCHVGKNFEAEPGLAGRSSPFPYNLCHECGSMHTSSSFASPVLNSLVHTFSVSLRVFGTW